jgi:(1->4)-alpha-D-glucan 1-alpha-D-glucosylmutase
MASELSVLAYLLNRLSEENRRSRDFTLGTLTDALRETIACFPIYRTYIDADVGRVSERDQEYVRQAIRVAKRRNRSMSASIFNFVEDTLLLRWPEGLDAEARREHARFVMKFQQLTGPIMAKGVEDTSFYIFNRLVSLNEVGGEPAHFGMPVEAFHQWIGARGERWPHAMNSTSTHDTKRSEDARGCARVHPRALRDPGPLAGACAALGADERRQAADGRRTPHPRPQRRVPPLPDAGRRLAAGGAGRGGARRLRRAHPAVHGEGDA